MTGAEYAAALKQAIVGDKRVKALLAKVYAGTATYTDAYTYAQTVSEIGADLLNSPAFSGAFSEGAGFDVIEDIVRSGLASDHSLIADFSAQVQTVINKRAGLGLKGLEPGSAKELVDTLVDDLRKTFDTVSAGAVKPQLDDRRATLARKTVDYSIKTNAEAQGKAGVTAIIVRKLGPTEAHIDGGRVCELCSRLAGTWTYPGIPSDLFMRHERCTCTMEYNAKKLTALSKSFR